MAVIGAGGIGFDVADFLTHTHTTYGEGVYMYCVVSRNCGCRLMFICCVSGSVVFGAVFVVCVICL